MVWTFGSGDCFFRAQTLNKADNYTRAWSAAALVFLGSLKDKLLG